jgi:hypothetical protein
MSNDNADVQYHRGFVAGEFVQDSSNVLDDEDRARIECELKGDAFRRGFEAGKRRMRAALRRRRDGRKP